MAQKSFNQRFPVFKWVLLLAVVISLPLTVFSVRNVSTNSSQHAAGYTCGPSGRNPACPASYYCSYTAGNPNFGGSCLPNLTITTAATSLTSSSTCTKGNESNRAVIKLNWSNVANAQRYYVYWYTKVGSSTVGSDTKITSTSATSLTVAIPNKGKFYWYVRGYNTYSKTFGPASVSKEVVLSCK